MHSFDILATICAATFGTTSALVDASKRAWVNEDANGYGKRTSGNGCSPDGCVPYNSRYNDLKANSRWSCQGDILSSSGADEGCCIAYYFEEPQHVVKMRVAFRKCDENSTKLDVYVNDDHHSTIMSSGATLGYQMFNLDTNETEELNLCLHDPKTNTDVWLSITEVRQGRLGTPYCRRNAK